MIKMLKMKPILLRGKDRLENNITKKVSSAKHKVTDLLKKAN